MHRSSVLNNLFFSYSNLFITLIGGVVLVPFYLNYLDIGEYGAWLSGVSLINILSISGGGLDITLTNRLSFYVAKDNKISFSLEFTSFFVIAVFSSLVILLVGTLLSFYLGYLLNLRQFDSTFRISFCLALVGFVFNYLFTIVRCIPLSLHNTMNIGILESVSKLLGIGILVFGLKQGWGLIAFGVQQLFTGLILLLFGSLIGITISKAADYKMTGFVLQDFIKQTKLVLPMFAGRAGSVLIQNISLPLVSNVMNPEFAGKFSITNRLYDAMNLFLNPVGRSFFPSFSNFFAKDKSIMENKFNLLTKLFLGLTIVCFFIICLINEEFVTLWVGKDKYAGGLLNVAFAVCGVVQVINDYSGLGLIAIGQQMKTVWYGLIDLALRVVILYVFFILGLGALALPFSQVISIGFLTFYLFRRLYKHSEVNLIFKNSFSMYKTIQFSFFCSVLYLLDQYQVSFVFKIMFSIPVLIYYFLTFNLMDSLKLLNIKSKIK